MAPSLLALALSAIEERAKSKEWKRKYQNVESDLQNLQEKLNWKQTQRNEAVWCTEKQIKVKIN